MHEAFLLSEFLLELLNASGELRIDWRYVVRRTFGLQGE
jgi:hypothetical protein